MYGISTRSTALVVDSVVIFKQNDSYPGQLSLAIPPWVGAMSTCQRAVMLCGWGVRQVWFVRGWQVKLCDPLSITGHI